MPFIPPSLTPTPNTAIMNAVRGASSNAYQSSVNPATKADIQTSIDQILKSPGNMNEFIDVLFNKVGLSFGVVQSFTNPLNIFKRGKLEYGEYVEEIAYGLAKAKGYDPKRNSTEADVWGQEPNDVQVAYHKRNRKDKYKVTINEAELRLAFTQENGLYNFVAGVMSQGTNADEIDEFYITANLLKEANDKGFFFKVNVPDVTDLAATDAEAKQFLKIARSLVARLKYPSRHYNGAHMPAWSDPSSLVLIGTPEAIANMDVGGLAGLFNMDRAAFTGKNIVEIPAELWGIPNAQAAIVRDDFFVMLDTHYETTSIRNPDGLYTNFWWHHWGIYSISPFAPAILLTTEAGDVIPDIETPVTGVAGIQVADSERQIISGNDVKRGFNYRAWSEAVTTPIDGANNAVKWTLSAKTIEAGKTLSRYTRINQNGTFTVAIDEYASVLTLTATSTDDNTKVATLDLDVVGTRLNILPTRIDVDTDNDGLWEIAPDAPIQVGTAVTIPSTNANAVQYKKDGTNVAAGSTSTISASTVYTAVAKTGFEIASGATASWTLTP